MSDSKSPLNISLDLALTGQGARPKAVYDGSLALMGLLMGVHLFDQPGVEEAKVLASKYLAET